MFANTIKNKEKHLLTTFLIIGCLFFLMPKIASAQSSTSTKIASPVIVSIEAEPKLGITGLTPVNSDVLVYVDGSYDGQAETRAKNTSSDSFSYLRKEALRNGTHKIVLLSRDKNSQAFSLPTKDYFITVGRVIENNSNNSNNNLLLPAPTITSPANNSYVNIPRPSIIGLTYNNTKVLFYVDSKLAVQTGILEDISEIVGFNFKLPYNLANGGHQVWAIAQDVSGRRSKASDAIYFNVSYKVEENKTVENKEAVPAPIMFEPVVNNTSTVNRPYIVGVAQNSLLIKIYIDNKLDGESYVKNSDSGVGNFSYQPREILTNGEHMLYAKAVNLFGTVSSDSNTIKYKVASSTISEEGVEEKNETKTATSSAQTNVKKETKKEEVKVVKTEKTSSKESIFKKVKLNLVIFILFLAGVILWIIWVNRELIKEKRALKKDEAKGPTVIEHDKKNNVSRPEVPKIPTNDARIKTMPNRDQTKKPENDKTL